jgi:hypothetical protein
MIPPFRVDVGVSWTVYWSLSTASPKLLTGYQ